MGIPRGSAASAGLGFWTSSSLSLSPILSPLIGLIPHKLNNDFEKFTVSIHAAHAWLHGRYPDLPKSTSDRRSSTASTTTTTTSESRVITPKIQHSGLSVSSCVDTRDFEAAFAKIGRVSKSSYHYPTRYQPIIIQVKKVSVVYDPHTQESHTFGLVITESVEETEAAVMALNATEPMGEATSPRLR
jgi:hypothetical protein